MSSRLRNGKRLQIPSIPKPKKPSNQKEYTYDQAVELVASFLTQEKGRRKTAIVSGAGASVESGIRAYRGNQGHYELHKKYRPIFYHEFMEDSEEGRLFRQRYWARSFFGYIPVQHALPNRVHYNVAALQYMNLVDKLVTQNVDRLHHRASTDLLNPDDRILELHGTLNFAVVPNYPNHPKKLRSELQTELAALNPNWLEFANSQTKLKQNPDGDVELPSGLTYEMFKIPNPNGLEDDIRAFYKPDVVFFGESLDVRQKEESVKAIHDADRILVIGSSLATYSAFRLIKQAIEAKKQVLMINIGPTRADDYDITKIELPAADVLQGAVKLLASKLPYDETLNRLSNSGVKISLKEIDPTPDPEATEAK
ncbi:DHS-like NAD/FAD-binding domain-containing protein [Wallemia mellicola]|uniref:DHS-like NAD/FAD-binding domain-containing protein n=1 Tax=Wallemia mellicola TaxID=1708541 RepID=A0A4T0TYV2_9BASI|nr:DHS-like NAD/FAD-binding domain-containing protein [Wallemia mellicola]TIC15699.1 DHS-like NAD/FAD-binding domain-containing protein [Wallemia mellicola]TIC21080.1 DHS-like NAD/FAD-binding domain-containing protein [Wallemia mellicola]TIC70611.1 DHS-like NAD/FAD-binding domain-containing protein [Wallemia mellicola]